MAGLDANGLIIKRLPDIISELDTSLRLQFGNDLDLTSDSLFGILNTIYAASNAENWELQQAIYNAGILRSATGKQLDDFVLYAKVTRLVATKSFVNLSLFGTSGTVIPVGTQFSDNSSNIYLSTVEGNLNTETSRTPINIQAAAGTGIIGEPSTTFQITINGEVFSKQFLWADSTDIVQIASDLSTLIGDQPNYTVDTTSDGNPEFIDVNLTFNDPVLGNVEVPSILNIINKDEAVPITISVLVTASPTSSHESAKTPFMGISTKVSTFTDVVNIIDWTAALPSDED